MISCPEIQALIERLESNPTGAEILQPEDLARINTDISRQFTGTFIATIGRGGQFLLLKVVGKQVVSKILPYCRCLDNPSWLGYVTERGLTIGPLLAAM